jgi:hypothetical protein
VSSLRIASSVLALSLAAACTTTTVTDRQMADPNEKVARPDRILVYDVAATAADLHADSALVGKHAERSTPPTAEEIAVGRELGAVVTEELVTKIQEMGLTAVRAEGAPPPAVGDLVIHGTFVALDEGSESERIVVGFGYGAAELHTVIEGYLMTEQGLRRLGSGKVESGGGAKSPGVAIPVVVTLLTANPLGIVVGGGVKAYGELSGSATIEGAAKRTADEIAKQLRPRFEQQGWIAPATND